VVTESLMVKVLMLLALVCGEVKVLLRTAKVFVFVGFLWNWLSGAIFQFKFTINVELRV